MYASKVGKVSVFRRLMSVLLSVALISSASVIASSPAYAEPDKKTLEQWINNPAWEGQDVPVTSESYVQKIADMLGVQNDDQITYSQEEINQLSINTTNDKSLDLDADDIPDGFPINIGLLVGLESLKISSVDNFVDPDFWSDDETNSLDNLKELILTNNGIQNIANLKNAPATLQHLDLFGNQIINLSGTINETTPAHALSSLTNLTYLNLSNNIDLVDDQGVRIRDLNELSALVNLEELNLSDNEIEDLLQMEAILFLSSLN